MSASVSKKASAYDVSIRLAVREDAEAISKLLRAAFGEFRNDYTPEAFRIVTPPPAEVVERSDEGPVWVAVLNEKIVGSVSVVPEPEWLYIRSMAVLPDAQGRGIARELLDVAQRHAVEKGYDTMFLYTTYFSKDAMRLYMRYGFKHVRDTTADEWYGTPGLAMEKKVSRKEKLNAIRS